jgi:preprotein translocase subunit SecE
MCTIPAKKFWPSLSVNSKKQNCNPYFIVIMITVLIMNVICWVVNFKTQNYFVISTTQNVYLRLSMYDCSNFVHSCRIFGISELLSSKQFKLIVKMTRIESRVTIAKGLFTLFLNVKKVTAKILWPP